MDETGVGHNSAPGRRWIRFYVDARWHPLVGCGGAGKGQPWTVFEAWMDLISEASWKQRQISNKGRIITLDRGELMAARDWLAQRWNWSPKQVRNFIAKLEAESMIAQVDPKAVHQNGQQPSTATGQSASHQKGQQKTNLAKVISISNYDIYQTAREISDLMEGQQNGHHVGQPVGAYKGQQPGQHGASKGPARGQNSIKDRKDRKDNPPEARAHTQAHASTHAEARAVEGYPQIVNPKSWNYLAGLDPEERKAQQQVGWSAEGGVLALNGFEDELRRLFPRVNVQAGMNIVTGELQPAKERKSAKEVRASIIRRFGWIEQDEAGRDRRASAKGQYHGPSKEAPPTETQRFAREKDAERALNTKIIDDVLKASGLK